MVDSSDTPTQETPAARTVTVSAAWLEQVQGDLYVLGNEVLALRAAAGGLAGAEVRVQRAVRRALARLRW